jgi:hypothetical protein
MIHDHTNSRLNSTLGHATLGEPILLLIRVYLERCVYAYRETVG